MIRLIQDKLSKLKPQLQKLEKEEVKTAKKLVKEQNRKKVNVKNVKKLKTRLASIWKAKSGLLSTPQILSLA